MNTKVLWDKFKENINENEIVFEEPLKIKLEGNIHSIKRLYMEEGEVLAEFTAGPDYEYSYDFETESEHFDVDGVYTHNCRSFATTYTPPILTSQEKVGFNEGYKDTYTVEELYNLSKQDPKQLKYRLFLRREGFYEGDVNEIDHFEETPTGEIFLICRPKFWGFFNGGVVTINIPHIALESKKNKTEFWRLLDQRCELAYKALVERYKSLKNAPPNAAPILRQHGALMRLSDKPWNNFIIGPRCTYSLGYAGLWETQLYMTGKKLSEDQSFANEILNFFNKKHTEWHTRMVDTTAICELPEVWSVKEEFEIKDDTSGIVNLNTIWGRYSEKIKDNIIFFENPIKVEKDQSIYKIYKLVKNKQGELFADVKKLEPRGWLNTSTYGTPEENLVQKFSDSLKRDFGLVEGITDHLYVTNSYHIDPAQPINAFDKIKIESKMMEKSTGGAISYIELPRMDDNLDAVEALVEYMYDNILYCELNIKRDICYRCNYHGVINIVRDNGKLVWECPSCRSRDASNMHIRRRVCGYIGDAAVGVCQSRLGDYEARVEHLNQDFKL